MAEYLTAPVVNSYLHNDSFPQDHRLGCGPIGYCGSKAAMRTIAKADVVVAMGSRLGPFGTLPQYDIEYWPADAKIIQVDCNLEVIGLSRKVEVGCCADVKEFAAELLSVLKGLDSDRKEVGARVEDVAREKKTWADELEGWSNSTSKLMHPRRFLKELGAAMPEGSIVTTDIGNNSSMANSYFTFNKKGVKPLLEKLRMQQIDAYKERLRTEENSTLFFICPNLCSRLDMDNSAEYNYKCPECGSLLHQQDNTKTVQHLKNKIKELEVAC